MFKHPMVCQQLADGEMFHVGRLPEDLMLEGARFAELWDIHPAEYHDLTIAGKKVKTPRWQQAYGVDYVYTGGVNKALPIPALLLPLLHWTQTALDDRLNGILVNWYDGKLGHYIGKHRDSTEKMIPGAPIVTISFGEQPTFRLRPLHGTGFIDFETTSGSVFVMPFATNQTWTHEITRSAKAHGRRISVTFRAFEPSENPK